MSEKKKRGLLQTIMKPKSLETAIPLRRRADAELVHDQRETWYMAMEDIVQVAIRNLRKRTHNNFYLSGVRDLESTCFSQSLMNIKNKWPERFEGHGIPPEVEIFSNPVGLISFQVHDRKYTCIKYPVGKNINAITPEYNKAIRELVKDFSSYRIDINKIPTAEELASILIDHLSEDLEEDPGEFQALGDYVVGEVLRPRRSAILDWQNRLEQWITDDYDHEDDDFNFYSYPIVEFLIQDGRYLVLLLISPLDQNFVDEKVTAYHQCAEITLSIYNVENTNYNRVIQSVAPQLKQAYGRVLFTSMHEEASRALTATFDDQSRILRYWVRMAAKGYDGLIEDGLSKGIFDSKAFVKSIVKRVLCANILNVESELYPFDRAFIFREAGSSSAKSIKEPIELTIMEAAILSNNPADRNQFLTARERKIRTTQDYERDASHKIIKDEDVLTFYLHSYGKDIIFSQNPKLTKKDKEIISNDPSSSLSTSDSNKKIFKIKPPEDVGETEISDVFSNLLGRLIKDNFIEKSTESPITGKPLFETLTFTEDFEQKRLMVTEKFDNRGLFYTYDHGIHLPSDIPFLHRLQGIYFEFLKVHYKKRDEQHLRDRYRQDNLNKKQMEQILLEHRENEKDQRKRELESRQEGDSDIDKIIGNPTSKVVYIAFSWELHDENMDILRSNRSALEDTVEEVTLLDEDCIYTMILVSDQDPEKSLSQLNSEKENLRMFFQLIMDRIWMDKKFELEKLNNRSKMIVSSLSQFSHRAKSFIQVKEHKDYLDREIVKLKSLTRAKGTTAKLIKLDKPETFFARLLQLPKQSDIKPEGIEEKLRLWLTTIFGNSSRDMSRLKLNVEFHSIPELKIRWSQPIVQETFDNILKNAAEAALDEVDPVGEPEVIIRIQAAPNFGLQTRQWFFYVLVENTGGPIPDRKLKKLNSPNPEPMEREQKEGGTGLGIYLSRFQLINDIGSGADLIYTNLENGNVQARLRLPASLIESISDEDRNILLGKQEINQDYVLYVEDFRDIYKKAVVDLQSSLHETRVDLKHKKSLIGASESINARIPIAVFTDYNILKHEDGRSATKMNGILLIKNILSKAKEKGIYPPIWVMTEENESEVLKGLKDEDIKLGAYSYKFVPGAEEYSQDFIQPGAFMVFSKEKNPTKINGFDQAITDLVGTGEQVSNELIVESSDVFKFDITLAGFKKLEKEYSNLLQSTTDTILYGQKIVANPDQLYESLWIWINGPRLTDPELMEIADVKPRPIYSHFSHDRILLHLKLESELYEQIPIELIYWGLSHNVLISPKGFGIEKAVGGWKIIKHDDKGPIAKFRHDMKNIFHDEKFEKCRVNLQSEIDDAENLLKNGDYDFLMLEVSLASQEKTSEVISQFLSKPKSIQDKRNRLNRITYNIQEILGEVKSQADSVLVPVREFQQMIYYLKEFLGAN